MDRKDTEVTMETGRIRWKGLLLAAGASLLVVSVFGWSLRPAGVAAETDQAGGASSGTERETAQPAASASEAVATGAATTPTRAPRRGQGKVVVLNDRPLAKYQEQKGARAGGAGFIAVLDHDGRPTVPTAGTPIPGAGLIPPPPAQIEVLASPHGGSMAKGGPWVATFITAEKNEQGEFVVRCRNAACMDAEHHHEGEVRATDAE